MSEQLSPFRIRQGRKVFDSYSAINSFSFALVTGNTITLYALALGASSTVVGLLTAFMFISFFAVPLGKIALRRSSLIKTFAFNWMMRNWSLIPLLIIPWLVTMNRGRAAVFILLAGVFLFNLFRGIGLIANNPVIGMLAPGSDRGEYIVRLSLINNGTALVATLFLALLLWHDAGIETYSLVILIGIITGVVASALLYKLPTPPREEAGEKPHPPPTHFKKHFMAAFKEANFRRFLATFLVIGLGIGMVRPFIIVYAKEVYGKADSLVTIFTVCSILGALMMGLLMRLAIDRLGARPLYVIYSMVSLISLAPLIIAPGIGQTGFAILFLCILAAVTNMGFAGQENAAQTYFFTMVPRESLMDLSMLYFIALGVTGAIGSVAGGALLDLLAAAGLPSLWAFRVFLVVTASVIGVGLYLQRRLQDLGSYPVLNTLAILFSPRDLRALTLLKKLDSIEDPDRETDLLAELGAVASGISADNLVAHLNSPRYDVRLEALKSMKNLKHLRGKMKDALMEQLRTQPWTTAATAARLLAQFNVQQAVPDLRSALDSPDYLLAGQAMVALATLRDERGQMQINEHLLTTNNPYILLRGIQAMEIYRNAASVPILLDLLRREDLPLHIVQETVLALAALMGIRKSFYYVLESYTLTTKTGERLLGETLEEFFAIRKQTDEQFRSILLDYYRDPAADSPLIEWILGFGKGHTGVLSAMLLGVVLDSELNRREVFRFFLCFWAASLFANPRLIEN